MGWKRDGVEYEADPEHREEVLEYFGVGKTTRGLSHNGEKKEFQTEWEKDDLEGGGGHRVQGIGGKAGLDCR